MSDLQIERDDRFIARERNLHRVAVAVMVLVVAAGAIGLFGYGPLSTTTRSGDGYRVTHPRFARNGAPLRVTIEGIPRERPQVWIDDAVLDATQLDRITPAAAAEQRTASGVTFVFDRGMLLMDRGTVLHPALDEHRINVNDILEEARRGHGLRTLDDVDYAVLERSGGISIIPRTVA